MSAHTPGPWGWTDGALYGSDAEPPAFHGGKTCVECGHNPWECGPPVFVLATSLEEAAEFQEHDVFVTPSAEDARLIAAAPELLDLLKALLETRGHHFIHNEVDGMFGWDERAAEVVAKATGATP